MKAIKVADYGDASVLKWSDSETIPALGKEQALVQIHASGVNFVDIYQRQGRYAVGVPFIPGLEGAGTVVKVDEAVKGFCRGDRVAYAGHLGSYSEYVAIHTDKLIKLPREMSFEEGAAFPLQGMTAHYLIHEYRKLKPGDVVLVHAAAGGVGRLVVQWAKHLGVTVIGTVSTEEKARVATEAGADHVILYTRQDFVAETKRITNGRGAQLIIDGVAKSTFAGDLDAAAICGHVVIFGASSGPADPISPNVLMPRCLTVSGGTLFHFAATREDIARRAREVLKGIKHGWLSLRIDTVIPLFDAEKAHRLLEGRKSVGKIILKVV